MLIAITSIDKTIDSQVDPHFGRAKFLKIYNLQDHSFKVEDNHVNLNAQQGAGIQTAEKIINLDAKILITGNCGPKAFKVLMTGGIKVFSANKMKINEAIKLFQDQKLNELTNPNVESHW